MSDVKRINGKTREPDNLKVRNRRRRNGEESTGQERAGKNRKGQGMNRQDWTRQGKWEKGNISISIYICSLHTIMSLSISPLFAIRFCRFCIFVSAAPPLADPSEIAKKIPGTGIARA